LLQETEKTEQRKRIIPFGVWRQRVQKRVDSPSSRAFFYRFFSEEKKKSVRAEAGIKRYCREDPLRISAAGGKDA
jgi:hypothetical protein